MFFANFFTWFSIDWSICRCYFRGYINCQDESRSCLNKGVFWGVKKDWTYFCLTCKWHRLKAQFQNSPYYSNNQQCPWQRIEEPLKSCHLDSKFPNWCSLCCWSHLTKSTLDEYPTHPLEVFNVFESCTFFITLTYSHISYPVMQMSHPRIKLSFHSLHLFLGMKA